MNKTHHDSGNHPAARRPRGVATNPRALLARNDHPLPRGTAVIARLMPSCGITNAVYQKLTGGSRRTALRELDALVQFGILDPKGKGRGAYYVLGKTKRAINAPIHKRNTKRPKGTWTALFQPIKPSMTSIVQTRHEPVNPVMAQGTNTPSCQRDRKGTNRT